MIKENKISAGSFQKIDDVFDFLEKNNQINAGYLFGSLATNNKKPLSDIDIAVYIDNSIHKKDYLDILLDLSNDISKILQTDEFDLVILNNASLRFAYNIISTGKLIFVKNMNPLIDFTEEIVNRYLDFKFYQEEFNSVFIDKLKS